MWAAMRAAVRLPAVLVSMVVLMLAYGLSPRSFRRWRRAVQVRFCLVLRWLIGLKVELVGEINGAGVTVFCANHVSYLDILVLSADIEGIYIAKSEVRSWPLFGKVATLTGTILVDRTPARARVQRAEIRDHLKRGENLILFPEGTSTDGSGVAPFKSTLLDVAMPGDDGPDIYVQPVSLAYVRDLAGAPLTGPRRGDYCWFGDMTLGPHLLRVLSLPGAVAQVRLLAPVRAADLGNRKDLARYCQAQVAAGVATSHGTAAPGERAAE